MTVGAALLEGCTVLGGVPVDTPFLDASVLLSEAAACTKEELYARMEQELNRETERRYRGYLTLRERGYPVSYIRQKKEFYGLEFLVDERVFVPRPDTETLVEAALALVDRGMPEDGAARAGPPRGRIHDACTGSGAVAVTLKCLRPEADVSASDISPEAGEVFLANCRLHLGRELPWTQSDLLEDVEGPFDLITANPPYLRPEEVRRMKRGGWPEPEIALDGGAGGLELPLRLVRQARRRLRVGGALLVEADPDQMGRLADELRRSGFRAVRTVEDLAGRARVIVGALGSGRADGRA